MTSVLPSSSLSRLQAASLAAAALETIPALLISKSANRKHRYPRSKLAVQLSLGIALAFASAFAHNLSPGLALVTLALQPHSHTPLCCKATPLLRSLADNPTPIPLRGRTCALTHSTLHACIIDPVTLVISRRVLVSSKDLCTASANRVRNAMNEVKQYTTYLCSASANCEENHKI